LWGKYLGVERRGRYLFTMEDCDASGGPADGHIHHGTNSFEEAKNKVISESNIDVAYFWHSPSRRLI